MDSNELIKRVENFEYSIYTASALVEMLVEATKGFTGDNYIAFNENMTSSLEIVCKLMDSYIFDFQDIKAVVVN